VFEHTGNFLSKLDGVVKTGNGWDARCPCRNDDSNPSLSVHEKPTGQILVYCHRGGGCNAAQICDSVGLELSDLMPPQSLSHGIDDYPTARPYTRGPGQEKKKLKLVAEYNYLDENGKLAFQKRRFVDENGKKTFRQRRPDGMGGWIGYLGDIPKILYNLPNVIKAKGNGEEIWVVEGEKDADTLNAMGVVATTMPNGAGGWLDIHTEVLAGATVLVVADNDESGKKHAAYVLGELIKAGCDAQAYCTPRCKDITDFLNDGGDTLDLIRFIPSGDDLIPVEPEEHPDDESEDYEEEVRGVPRIDSEGTLGKLRELLADESTSPALLLTKASFLITSQTTSMPGSQGKLVDWDEFVAETDVDIYDWLIPGLLERRERVIVVAAEGVGKRATLTSMIPTPSGWTTLGNVSVGDLVIDRFGNPVKVTYVSPVEENPDAYRVTFSDGNYIDADAEHQWYTETLNEREKRKLGGVRTTKEILDTLVSNRRTKALNHAIPTTKPLNLPEANLPIPPYTLGAWLGDGTTHDGSICSEDDEVLEAIRNDGYVVRKRESTPNIYGILGLQVQLKEHGLYGNKHIPLAYTRSSYEQRLALIQGLMDTDGYVRSDGLCEFSVTHHELAKGFLDVIQTLGIKATMHEGDAKLSGRITGTRYRISFKTDIPVCRLKRKAERLPKKLATPRSLYRYIVSVEKIAPVPMRCISVDGPDNTYLIGEAYIPTHNTMLARQVAITTACGVQPFSFQRMPPITTLTVDLENPERIIRRSSRSIMNASKSLGFCLKPRANLVIKPDGLNLLDASDRFLLESYMEQVKPDLLVMGPLYKAFLDPGNKTSEAVAIDVVKYLDSLRVYFDCAMWLEHHAPLGESQSSRNLRPFGSAVWSRWPEFGLALQPDPTSVGEYVYDVKHFRGERDERYWPVKMRRGKSGKWPFETIEFKRFDDGGPKP
jgi:hypothetical protein